MVGRVIVSSPIRYSHIISSYHPCILILNSIPVASRFYPLISTWIDERTLHPTKTRIIEGGLAGVDGGLREMQEGRVHAKKLVYLVGDTPGVA